MNESIKKKSFVEILDNTRIFRTVYFINLLFSTIVFLDMLSIAIDGILMIWAFFIFKDKFIKNKNILKIKHNNILLYFIVSALITTLIHVFISFPLNFGFDLVMILHFAICFFVFYGMHIEEKTKIYSDMINTFKFAILFITSMTLISFIVALFKSKIVIQYPIEILNEFKHVVGMYETGGTERFTGLYANPNILAFCSVISIIFCNMLLIENSFLENYKKWVQVMGAVSCICINLIALILSDSIASFLLLILYVVFLMFYNLVISEKHKIFKKNNFINFILFITFGILLIVGSIGIRFSLQNGASDIINDIYSIASEKSKTNYDQPDINFGRVHYDLKDGSGRKTLLRQASIIFKHNPIMGIGISNIEKYGKMYFESGIAFPNLHNGYVTILVCYGIVGFLFFISFLIILFSKFFKFTIINRKNKNIFPHLFSIILSYSVYSLFEKTIISEINFIGIFFWLMLGYASMYLFCKENKTENAKDLL